MADKYNASRDLHQRRIRSVPATPPTWDILQTLFGFAFTIQQEIHKLRLETTALINAQPAPAAVQSGYPAALGRIVVSAQNLTEASGAAIALGTEQSMVCVARSGTFAPPLGSEFDGRSGLSGECIRNRDSVICMNAAADPRVDYNACMALGVRSMVYLPLLSQDRVAGVLAVFSSKPQHFSHRDLNCLRWTDQLISEAINSHGTEQVGAASLVRTVEFALSPAPPQVEAPPVKPTLVPSQSQFLATPAGVPVVAAAHVVPVEPTPMASPTFLGTVVDESIGDEFFSEPESDPTLAPRFNQGDEYDSPIPILVAMLLVVAFLGAVSFVTYKRLTSAVTPAPTKPASTLRAVATQPVTNAQPEVPLTSTPAIPTPSPVKTTPGFPPGVSFQSSGNHATLGIALSKPVTYEGFAIQGPDRVYFDIHGISLVGSKGTSVAVNDNLVSRVRISVFRTGTTRIVFDLKGDTAFQVKVSETANQLAIDVSPKNASEPGAISPKAGEAVKITSSGNQVLRTPALPADAAK